MSEKKVWFNWHCPHCQHRNRESFQFQFELPRYYEAMWKCRECLMESKIEFDFRIQGWTGQLKAPRLKKRIREKKEIKKEIKKIREDNSYKNNSRRVWNKK